MHIYLGRIVHRVAGAGAVGVHEVGAGGSRAVVKDGNDLCEGKKWERHLRAMSMILDVSTAVVQLIVMG